MKNATCYLHGLDLRPDLCSDCARCTPVVVAPSRVLRLSNADHGAMERTYDQRGHVGFRLVRPVEAPAKLDPWANAR
jgi:hypothetical protein